MFRGYFRVRDRLCGSSRCCSILLRNSESKTRSAVDPDRKKERRGGWNRWLLESRSIEPSTDGVLYDRFAAPRTERALEPDIHQGDLASRIVFRLSASGDVGVIAHVRAITISRGERINRSAIKNQR